ncbi:MAG: hypothetical protein A3J79_04000 [Elusimicrobia bacterium RIFOXYB2_FULL_62_6]|nr:MAG: hypothetical protein A3J79_04000 [Elusimicrobia bacterium RIFOXYB2_FULL_62_6]
MAEVFELEHKVSPDEIDGLGHVNNLVYLGWFIEAASAHSEAAGWPHTRMINMGEGWVIRRHEIDYLAQVMPQDTVVIKTWIDSAERTSSVRKYEIIRPLDGKTVCRGLTVWVWINYGTGRAARIPEELYGAFSVAAPQARERKICNSTKQEGTI